MAQTNPNADRTEDFPETLAGAEVSDIEAADHYHALLEEIEDLKDRLSVHERTGVTISADKLQAKLDS